MRDADARRSLKADLERLHCRVHQPEDPPLFTREPRSAMKPVHWRWSELEPLLERIGREMDIGSGGQRRTLRLANPGLPFGTTPTFWGSIQVILPGEVAEAHRHTANALRFIMKGHGATTTVDGERFAMNEGDLVLTPGGTWHDHEHRGERPMIWLDVLDISLMQALHASFFDPYEAQVQPVRAEPRQSALVHRYGQAIEYPSMSTLAMKLHRLNPGSRTERRRHTGSKLLYFFRGAGTTRIEDRSHAWTAGDFIAIPPWTWHEHTAAEDAVVFEVNDTPAMKALGYYREETRGETRGETS
jgi:gentisate 1,2-dioxygenase